MLVIGLTGGIGAGKSTVSAILKEAGYPILDADKISHEITEKGSETLVKLADVFGRKMILPDGNLDRKKLASVVFSDDQKLRQLEEITTKEVVRIISERLKTLKSEGHHEIVFVDAPLLFESGADRLTDLVWMVDADMEVRIRRVMERDGVSRQEVLQRIDSQMSSAEKAARSEIVIDNSEGKEALCRKVKHLLRNYAETK